MNTNVEKNLEKRKYISKEDALLTLKEYCHGIFNAYFNALDKYNVEINQTIPEARTRLNSALLNAKLTESFILEFPEQWVKGKYGRIIFRWENIQMLIKKLNTKDKPSYIPTLLSDSIINQTQTELFTSDDAAKKEAILIFGYTKDMHGQLNDPRIVYYDNGVKWKISQEDIVFKPISNVSVEEINVTAKKNKGKEAK